MMQRLDLLLNKRECILHEGFILGSLIQFGQFERRAETHRYPSGPNKVTRRQGPISIDYRGWDDWSACARCDAEPRQL